LWWRRRDVRSRLEDRLPKDLRLLGLCPRGAAQGRVGLAYTARLGWCPVEPPSRFRLARGEKGRAHKHTHAHAHAAANLDRIADLNDCKALGMDAKATPTVPKRKNTRRETGRSRKGWYVLHSCTCMLSANARARPRAYTAIPAGNVAHAESSVTSPSLHVRSVERPTVHALSWIRPSNSPRTPFASVRSQTRLRYRRSTARKPLKMPTECTLQKCER
jgi:hypothetical protein